MGRLIGWLVGWLAGWLIELDRDWVEMDGLVGRSVIGWLVGWSVGRLVGWSVGRLVGWLFTHTIYLFVRLTDQSIFLLMNYQQEKG